MVVSGLSSTDWGQRDHNYIIITVVLPAEGQDQWWCLARPGGSGGWSCSWAWCSSQPRPGATAVSSWYPDTSYTWSPGYTLSQSLRHREQRSVMMSGEDTWSLVRPSGLELFKLVFPSKQGILIMTGAWSKFDILYFITIHSEQRNGPSSFLAMNFSIGF